MRAPIFRSVNFLGAYTTAVKKKIYRPRRSFTTPRCLLAVSSQSPKYRHLSRGYGNIQWNEVRFLKTPMRLSRQRSLPFFYFCGQRHADHLKRK